MEKTALSSVFLDLNETDMLKAWSYSRLADFEQCRKRAFLKYVQRVPEPPRPLPPGKTEQANERGIRVHEAAEAYVKGGVELLPELRTFEEEYKHLRVMYDQGLVSLEGEWAFNKDWEPVAWKSDDCWLRMKLDSMVMLSPEHAVVIDYKTGKYAGKQVKYAEQMILYQIATFLRNPKLKRVTVELWLTDENELVRTEFTRIQGLKHMKRFDERGNKVTDEREFKPNPNVFSCKWCPYREGICQDAITSTARHKPAMLAVAQPGGFVPWD